MTELVTRHFAKNKKKSEDAQDVKFDSHVRKFKPKMGHFWLAWASSNSGGPSDEVYWYPKPLLGE